MMITYDFRSGRRGVSAFAALLVALLLAGCSAAQPDTPPPDWIVGTYHYAGNGSIAKRFPWQANANLVLERDGQYTLGLTVHIEDDSGGDTDSDESYGAYRVDGNRLILEPANREDAGDVQEFEIQGRRLVPQFGWPARLALKGFRIPQPVFVKTE